MLKNVQSWTSDEDLEFDVTIVRVFSKVMVFVDEEERLTRSLDNEDTASQYFELQISSFQAHPQIYLDELG